MYLNHSNMLPQSVLHKAYKVMQVYIVATRGSSEHIAGKQATNQGQVSVCVRLCGCRPFLMSLQWTL